MHRKALIVIAAIAIVTTLLAALFVLPSLKGEEQKRGNIPLSLPVTQRRGGDLVTWRNGFEVPIVLCDDRGYFCSGVLGPGEAFTVSFPISGTFTVKAKTLQGEEIGQWEVRVQ